MSPAPANTLEPSASMVCTLTGTAGVGPYQNTVTASATGRGPSGQLNVTDEHPSGYIGYRASITVAKDICVLDDLSLCDPDDDAAWGPVTRVDVGAQVVWRLIVTNTGTVDLSPVTVSDPLAPTCTRVIVSLEAGASTRFACNATADRSYTNRVEVSGQPNTDGGTPIVDSSTGAPIDPVVGSAEASVAVRQPPTTSEPIGELPATGSDSSELVTWAVVCVAAGVVAISLARRRRHA